MVDLSRCAARRARTLAVLFFLLLSLAALRPLLADRQALPAYPGLLGRLAEADRNLNIWILAWVAHAVATGPGHLFDANILAPARGVLAGSEHMLGHLPFTLPVWLATGDAVLVYKAVLLESFVLTGLLLALLVRRQTGSLGAGLVAGAALTLAPWRLGAPWVGHPGVGAHPQYLALQYLPLATIGIDRWHERLSSPGCEGRGAAGGLVVAAGALAMQGLVCFYLGFFSFVALGAYGLALVAVGPAGRRWRRLGALLLPFLVAAAVVGFTALPYLRYRVAGIVPTHGAEELVAYSLRPGDYVGRAALLMLGPVLVVLVLLALFVAAGRRWRGGRMAAEELGAWSMLASCVVLSLGPYLEVAGGLRLPLPYLPLHGLVPGFSSMRAPMRAAYVASVAAALLGGRALAEAGAFLGRRGRVAAGAALVAAAFWWSAGRACPVAASGLGRATPAVYRYLAGAGAGGRGGKPILEVPAARSEADQFANLDDSRYMLYSTLHWRRLVNGYTAYRPPSFALATAYVRYLPGREGLQGLVDLADLGWIIVHSAALPTAERAAWSAAAAGGSLAEVARFGEDVVYRVRLERSGRWAGRRAPEGMTVEGTPKAPLPSRCRRGVAVPIDLPPILHPAVRPAIVHVAIENRSGCAWPGLDVEPRGLVTLTYRWVGARGALRLSVKRARLVHDLPPGSRAIVPLPVFPPSAFGHQRLEVLAVQEGQDEPVARGVAETEVVPLARTGGGGEGMHRRGLASKGGARKR